MKIDVSEVKFSRYERWRQRGVEDARAQKPPLTFEEHLEELETAYADGYGSVDAPVGCAQMNGVAHGE